MNIILGKKIKIKELKNCTQITIINYLNKHGIIKGKKNIYGKYYAPLIEFQDYTRLWIMPQELEII
uniref:Cytochrome b6-f complex subunit PetP n=1 Tax=Leiomenia cribrosa TaxID=217483 RepID=A0A4D6WV05_9FLOR|nr:cytochrome b6-f complex subunit PetP [Leiomenia cribrosa]